MKQEHKELSLNDVHFATKRVREVCERAEAICFDLKRHARREMCKCVACFYSGGRIGGAAMTQATCGICAKLAMFSSTATDRLCIECAKKHDLCVQCGCDMELKRRRKVQLA